MGAYFIFFVPVGGRKFWPQICWRRLPSFFVVSPSPVRFPETEFFSEGYVTSPPPLPPPPLSLSSTSERMPQQGFHRAGSSVKSIRQRVSPAPGPKTALSQLSAVSTTSQYSPVQQITLYITSALFPAFLQLVL